MVDDYIDGLVQNVLNMPNEDVRALWEFFMLMPTFQRWVPYCERNYPELFELADTIYTFWTNADAHGFKFSEEEWLEALDIVLRQQRPLKLYNAIVDEYVYTVLNDIHEKKRRL